jgi:XTP/dITP diphosphohydrolase
MTTPARRLLVATTNPGKIAELARLFAGLPGLAVIGPDDIGPLPEVIEDGDTFEANAVKKARAIAQATGIMTLADDSGLEVDALDGAPGVFSARYAGEGASDVDNNARLLAALEGVPDEARTARFRCVLAVVDPERAHADLLLTQGTVEGSIGHAPRGSRGFGYDPLFVVLGRNETMAELAPDEKDRLSHRAEAARAMRAALEAWLA